MYTKIDRTLFPSNDRYEYISSNDLNRFKFLAKVRNDFICNWYTLIFREILVFKTSRSKFTLQMNTKLLCARFTFSNEFLVCLVGLVFSKLYSYMAQSLSYWVNYPRVNRCRTNLLFLAAMSCVFIEYIFMHQLFIIRRMINNSDPNFKNIISFLNSK